MSTEPARLRLVRTLLPRLTRFREIGLLLVAAATGVLAGLVVTAMGWFTHAAHVRLYGVAEGSRLSAQSALATPLLALIPAAGGVVIGLSALAARHLLARPPVDPIEANALHGGRMGLGESLFVAGQTVVSSGCGASVGLEAGYTQASAALASKLGGFLELRRSEVRMLVGCGAAGAISAAFGAPITGAFYAFELIIGTYTVALVAPVMAASVAASLTAAWLGAVGTPVTVGAIPAMTAHDLLPFLALGVVGGLAAVALMQLVTAVERGFSALRCPPVLRPALGGLVVGGLALWSPEVLSSGHGALHIELGAEQPWTLLALLFGLKALASAVSLGAGFRGGLFFASLFLGALLGKLFAAALVGVGAAAGVVPVVAAVVGMASMAVGVVGGPMTMTFLVLETTGDLAISVAVLAVSIMSAVVVRETFGYSFSTWRLHLRGETIRSAHDVGWMRNLTVGSMMRADVRTVPLGATIAAFRAAYPLGAAQRVIAIDPEGRYAGIVIVADAHAAAAPAADATIGALVRYRDAILLPSMSAEDAARLFEIEKSEELAVVDGRATLRVVGLLTEPHLLRRYAEELDKARRDLAGER
ncbi:chloride channel protein [Prosthecomicrobium pneumaticum]|uniref:CIC family chloride channel protein n=1 Tax=Prosthecomicrobium pneumaticum TaxID=81895 RepID=A0A7W9FLZ8_9HYPH|nr:chloride channel protein [Prosthecomicrobium pneumaticum]MBB5753137.1 CIC family chloride channel protein [Prosthecomicrobium pneumaticum]